LQLILTFFLRAYILLPLIAERKSTANVVTKVSWSKNMSEY